MEKLSIMDTLALARAGYKKSEIKEIMEQSNATEELPAPAEETSVKHEAEKEPEVEKPVADDGPDYKTMFEEMQKKYDAMASKLEAAQKANINTDVSKTQTKLSTSETINNIFREVIS